MGLWHWNRRRGGSRFTPAPPALSGPRSCQRATACLTGRASAQTPGGLGQDEQRTRPPPWPSRGGGARAGRGRRAPGGAGRARGRVPVGGQIPRRCEEEGSQYERKPENMPQSSNPPTLPQGRMAGLDRLTFPKVSRDLSALAVAGRCEVS